MTMTTKHDAMARSIAHAATGMAHVTDDLNVAIKEFEAASKWAKVALEMARIEREGD